MSSAIRRSRLNVSAGFEILALEDDAIWEQGFAYVGILGTLALASLLEKGGLLGAPVKPESFGEVRYDLLPKKPHKLPKLLLNNL